MIAVFDTNIVIDTLNGIDQADTEYEHVLISRITWMEVLVGVQGDAALVRDFLSTHGGRGGCSNSPKPNFLKIAGRSETACLNPAKRYNREKFPLSIRFFGDGCGVSDEAFHRRADGTRGHLLFYHYRFFFYSRRKRCKYETPFTVRHSCWNQLYHDSCASHYTS